MIQNNLLRKYFSSDTPEAVSQVASDLVDCALVEISMNMSKKYLSGVI